jgi:DNA-binding NarL/FixJ family response regulator
MKPARIIVIEDEQLVASMLTDWLAGIPGLTVAGAAHSVREGLSLCRSTTPDLALIDIKLPDGDGLTLAGDLLNESKPPRIIILSSHCDPYCVRRILQLGLPGYVDKNSPMETLKAAIESVLNLNCFYSKAFLAVQNQHLSKSDAFHKILSPREISVLMLVVEGLDDETLAARLNISSSTASTHRRNLRHKLGAHNTRDLINYGRQLGLTPSL